MSLLRLNRDPTGKQLLVFGVAWALFVGGLALSQEWRGHPSLALGLGALALGVPLAGLAWPRGLRHLFVGLSYATYPVGFVVSHVVLALLYYLVLTPIGLLLKLCRHDPLARRFDPAAPTYWQQRDNPKPPASYLRQI